MDAVIGIDLGTTYSCVGVYINNNVEIVKTITGDNAIPSRVYFDKRGDFIGVGNINGDYEVVYNSKRFIGKKYSEISVKDMNLWSFNIEKSEIADIPEVVVKDRRYTAIEISSFILKELKELADKKLNKSPTTPTNAIITVPAYFTEKQREATKKAAELANLKVLQLLNEPTSAAFGYFDHLNKLNKNSNANILVYDFGGGTFDVSVVKVNHNDRTITVLKTDGDDHLGGEDIDQILLNVIIGEYKDYNQNNREPNKNVLLKFKHLCENAKRILSSYNQANISFADILNMYEDDYIISREDFLELNKQYLDKTFEIVRNVTRDVGEIDCIVLVGGSSKIPFIKENLGIIFGDENKIKNDINTEEVVAIGATLYGNNKVLNGYKFKDIISHSLSTDIVDGKSQFLFRKNSEIPASIVKVYSNTDDSGFIHIGIYEGEENEYNSNKYLGGCNIPITSAERGKVKLIVTYTINKSGVIEISAKEESPNKHEIFEKINLSE